MYSAFSCCFLLCLGATFGIVLEVDMSRDCGQVFFLSEGATDSLDVKSHKLFGRRNYERNVKCKTTINTVFCEKVRFDCPVFNVRGLAGRCQEQDYLKVNDKYYCGLDSPRDSVLSNVSSVTVEFESSWFFSGRGFKCKMSCEKFVEKEEASDSGGFGGSAAISGCVCGTSSLSRSSLRSSLSTSDAPLNTSDFRRTPQRVVNGVSAKTGEIRWQVGLTSSATAAKAFVWCGGTLLNDKFVMTAAHCTVGVTAARIYAIVGMTDTTNPSAGVTIQVANKLEHPSYNSDTSDYDYSILTMTASVDFTALTHVAPICWPTARPADGTQVLISGWGNIEFGGPSPTVMKRAYVKTIAYTDCASKIGYYGYITDRMLCAGIWPLGGTDTCQGDSGGPLVALVGSNYELFGVTSFGDGCAGPLRPGVYSDVVAVKSWLTSNVAGGECARS
jgi:trypsin